MEVSQCLMPLTQEVMEVLKEVKDPGLGKDIVAWRLAIFQCELDVPFVLEPLECTKTPRSFHRFPVALLVPSKQIASLATSPWCWRWTSSKLKWRKLGFHNWRSEFSRLYA